MEHRFICFEGVDASGKSSVAEALVKELPNFAIVETPHKILLPKKEWADRDIPERGRYYYYIAGCYMALAEIYELRKDHDVLLIRYFYCTNAYYYAKSGERMEMPKDVLPPSNIAHFTVPDEDGWDVIKRRLAERGKDRKPWEKDSELLRRMDAEYRRIFAGLDNVVEVCTMHGKTNRQPEDVAQEIIGTLGLERASY